ncbi:MAG: hypothetical protein LBI19_07205 [Oscillospiraceae bacterium]|jgi:hypothetical protein|nr:hypothetical protein [Oscillospiraceae bacterium]
MKRKAILTLALAVVLIAVFATPAFAATTNLAWPPPLKGGAADNQWGWNSIMDNEPESTFDADAFVNARYLVIEVSNTPEEGDLDFVWQGSGNGWGWAQQRFAFEDVWQDGKIVFDLTKASNADKIKDTGGDGGAVKFFAAYWEGGGWADLGVTKAYLTSSLGGGGGGGGAARTGDATLITLAVIALALAAGASVFVVRKLKA